MDPQHFIGLARALVENIDVFNSKYAEATYRTAINRLYYGVLHWMQKRLSINVPRSKVQAYHSYVVQQLESLFDDEYLIDFHLLMKGRTDADYFLEFKITNRRFKECLDACERIVGGIEKGMKFAFDPEEDLKYYKKYRDN